MVRKHGEKPYHIVVLHGGPGAAGSAYGLAKMLSETHGVLEPMQSRDTISGLENELENQIDTNCTGKVTLVGHSWGALLAGLFAEKYPFLVKKIVLIGCAPLDAEYAPDIILRRKHNMTGGEREEFGHILKCLDDKNITDKDIYLLRLGKICDKADGYEEFQDEQESVNLDSELYEKIWKEACHIRESGEMLKRFKKIQCPVVLIQGIYDPHPVEGIMSPLAGSNVALKTFILEKCGHTPWKEKYAVEEFKQILNEELD